MTAPGTANLVTHLVLPNEMGRHISSTIYVEYSNTGTVAMPAPLLVLYAPPEVVNGQTIINKPLLTLNPALVVSGYWTSAIPAGYSNSIEILATGKEVPGMLEPGESVTVPVYYAGMQQPWSFAETSFQFKLDIFTQRDTTALDWSSLQGSLQPPGISTTAWNAISSSLATQVGGTWGGYVSMLDNEASYLGQLGEDVTDVSQLWAFAIMQADGLTPTPVLASSTDLAVAVPGQLSLDFSPDLPGADQRARRDRTARLRLGRRLAVCAERGLRWHRHRDLAHRATSASSSPIAAAAITSVSRATTASSPRARAARSPCKRSTARSRHSTPMVRSNYIQDTNGNRITAGYTGGQLTSLTDTSGASLTIAYNAAGLIASVTSSDGRAVKYTYDSGEHLTSVTGYDGKVTQYTYIAGSNLATQNALASIQFPDGTSQSFTYNAAGQLAGTSQTGGADPVSYGYNVGEVTVTDAAGRRQSILLRRERPAGQDRRPAGNTTLRHV